MKTIYAFTCALLLSPLALDANATPAPTPARTEVESLRYQWYLVVAPKSKKDLLSPTELNKFFNDLGPTLEIVNENNDALSTRLVSASKSSPYDLRPGIQLSAHLQTMAAVAQLSGHKALHVKVESLRWQWSAHVEAIAEIAEASMREFLDAPEIPAIAGITIKHAHARK